MTTLATEAELTEKEPYHEAAPSVIGAHEHITPVWYRSVFFQSTVVGACAFLAPGLFNAMSLTGAGGSQSPYLVNTANAILYAVLTVICVFGGFFTNFLGFRFALSIGAAGYCIYAAGLYTNIKYGNEWLVILGAVLTGLCGGVFWATEGAIMIGYPEPAKVGRYLGLWLGWRNAGTVIGAAILLGLNSKTTTSGHLSASTFLVFVVLQAIGPLVGLLLSPPDKVQRPDGTPILMSNPIPIRTEAGLFYSRVLKRWDVWALCPIMLYATWFNSYAGTFLALHYNVRSRALASFISAVLSIVANVVLGYLLDSKRLGLKAKARFAYITVVVLNIAMWIWFIVVQMNYLDHPASAKSLDWTQGGTWYRGWGVYVFAIIMYNINANLLYWIISTLSTNGQDAVRLAGVLRGVEAAGSAGGFGMNSKKTLSVLAPLYFNFALCIVSCAIAYPVVHRIGAKAKVEEEES